MRLHWNGGLFVLVLGPSFVQNSEYEYEQGQFSKVLLPGLDFGARSRRVDFGISKARLRSPK
jgi:hypothetical protein